MSFKTKKIPEHLIIRPSSWDRPKKRGRWILWLIGPLVCFGILVFAVESMAVEKEELGSGQLFFRNQSGIEHSALHLSSKVAIEISGIVAHIKLTQTFSNHTDSWQEGRYVFPLPETAAVNFMQMKIGNRLIKAVVKKKEEAREIYKVAKINGQKASLLEQSRPNLFSQKISNIGPRETIIVELHFVQHVEYDSGSFSLRFPTTFTPRYMPFKTEQKGGREREQLNTLDSGWSFTTGNKPMQTIDKIKSETSDPITNAIEITVNLNSGLELDQITSPYHEIKIRKQNKHHRISLKEGSTLMDRDFVLEWQPTKSNLPQAALFREHIDGEDYALLMVLPPNHQAETHQLPKEMIFVIDTSGSMGGESIRQAKESLDRAINDLRPQDQFNLIEFNSLYSRLFYESQDANPHNKQVALNWINRLTAGGGTEMLPALRAALRPSQVSKKLKQIIFITDGAVGNETELFSLIHKKLGAAKLFTVGIGSAPNSYFMRKAAQFGGGTFTHIGDTSELSAKMSLLLQKLEHPLVREITISWNKSTESYPKQIPSLYLNEPLLIVAKTKKLNKSIKIQGFTALNSWSQKLTLNKNSSQTGIGTLWARAKIESLEDEKIAGRSAEEVKQEVVKIALQHQLVSPYTSLIAVEEAVSRDSESNISTSQIPNLYPMGQGLTKLNYPKTASGWKTSLWIGLFTFVLGLMLTNTGILKRHVETHH